AQADDSFMVRPVGVVRADWEDHKTCASVGEPPWHGTLADDVRGRLQPSSRPDSLGRLDQYEILNVIGEGGFGSVVKAFDERLHRVAAVKILSPHLAASGTARQRFLREARSAAAVRDQHVVTVYAVSGDADPLPYLVMELIVGKTLQRKIENEGALRAVDVLRIGSQIAKGLAAAHATGLIHRDVKPANVLLENGVERVKLTDFGLARAADDSSLSQAGLVAGTPLYMSPEQARGDALDQRSDLFSLGSVLYTMATGGAPFRAATTQAVLRRVCEDRPTPPREIEPGLPPWLVEIIEKLHAKAPANRYQTAAEVADLLEQRLADLQLRGGVDLPAPRFPTSRGLVARGGVGLALLVLVALLSAYAPHWFSAADAGGASRGEPTSQVTPIDEPPPVPVPAPTGAERLAVAVRELKRLNPDFDDAPANIRGWLSPQPQFEAGRLVGLGLNTEALSDLSPLAELRDLRRLQLSGNAFKRGPLKDVSPLQGLPLEGVILAYNPQLSDVSALTGMRLQHCDLSGTDVHDVELLRPMPLNFVQLLGAPVDDLAPLAGKPLKRLTLTPSKIKNYSKTGISVAAVESLGCRILELPSDAEMERLGVRELDLYSVEPARDRTRLLELREWVKTIDWKPAHEVYDRLDAPPQGDAPPQPAP
ncbi:MAG TPA: serine/threonine-protein kinase, partial [Pirellulales bacterium]